MLPKKFHGFSVCCMTLAVDKVYGCSLSNKVCCNFLPNVAVFSCLFHKRHFTLVARWSASFIRVSGVLCRLQLHNKKFGLKQLVLLLNCFITKYKASKSNLYVAVCPLVINS